MYVELTKQLDVASLADVPVVLEVDIFLGRDVHKVSKKSCRATVSIDDRMNSHGFGMHGHTERTRREVVGVLPPVSDVVQSAAQFDRNLLRCDPNIDFMLPLPSGPDPEISV